MARLYAGERAAIRDPRPGYACTSIAPIRTEPLARDSAASPLARDSAASQTHSRHARFLRRMGMFGLDVATEALGAAGLGGGSRVGLFSGVGGLRAHWDDMIGAFANQRDDGERMWERGLRDVHPYWMLRHLSNNVHAIASAELDLRGEGATFGGGNAGAQALAAASRALQDDAIDAAVVVAYDSLLEPETLVELAARGTAADARGYVPGEAAAALVVVRDATAPIARLAVRTAAGPGGLARCAAALSDGARVVDITAALGQVGAATSIVQAIALAEMLDAQPIAPIAGLEHPRAPVTRPTSTTARIALGLHASDPGLASAIRVEVMR
jgi:hypothetical protein